MLLLTVAFYGGAEHGTSSKSCRLPMASAGCTLNTPLPEDLQARFICRELLNLPIAMDHVGSTATTLFTSRVGLQNGREGVWG